MLKYHLAKLDPSTEEKKYTPIFFPIMDSWDPDARQKFTQQKIEEIISQFESIQEKNTEVTSQLEHFTNELESQQTAFDKETIATLQEERRSIHETIIYLKNCLLICVDELKIIKTYASDQREIEHSLSIASQKIAAANFAIADGNVIELQVTIFSIQHAIDIQSRDFEKNIAIRKIAGINPDAADGLQNPVAKIYEDMMDLAERNLSEAKVQLQKTEKILQQANSDVEKARFALDQCMSGAELPGSAEDAILTHATPAPLPGDSVGSDEAQAHEQVIAVGMEDQLNLV